MGAASTQSIRSPSGSGQPHGVLDVSRFIDRMANATASGFGDIDELVVGSGGESAARLTAPADSKHRLAWVGARGSAAELLSEIAASGDEALLVLAPSSQAAGWCFYVADKRVVGVVGPAPDGTFSSWASAFDVRHGVADEIETRRRERSFVFESVIAALACSDSGGAKVWVTSGHVEWLAARHDPSRAPGLSQLVMEYARRADELPGIRRTVGSGACILVPVSEPGDRPTRAGETDDPDFCDDPDGAAMAEWADVRRLWSLCDGTTSIDRVVERAMLGEFRGMAAVAALLERGHVAAVDGMTPTADEPAANLAEYGEELAFDDDDVAPDVAEDQALAGLESLTEMVDPGVDTVDVNEASDADNAAPVAVESAPSVEVDLSPTGPIDVPRADGSTRVSSKRTKAKRRKKGSKAGVFVVVGLLAAAGAAAGAWMALGDRASTPPAESTTPPSKSQPTRVDPPPPASAAALPTAADLPVDDESSTGDGLALESSTGGTGADVEPVDENEDDSADATSVKRKATPRRRRSRRSRTKSKPDAAADDLHEEPADALPEGEPSASASSHLPSVGGSDLTARPSTNEPTTPPDPATPAPSSPAAGMATPPAAGLPPAPDPDNPAFGVPATRPDGSSD